MTKTRDRTIKIYLAGKVPKEDNEKTEVPWRQQYCDTLGSRSAIEFLSPENDDLDESDPLIIVGNDLFLLKSSDVVVVNASEKLGVGTAQEMVMAKYYRKPVLTVLPKNTHHRRSNTIINGKFIVEWIHPFLVATSDVIFSSVDDLSEFLMEKLEDGFLGKVKDISVFDDAVLRYEHELKMNAGE